MLSREHPRFGLRIIVRVLFRWQLSRVRDSESYFADSYLESESCSTDNYRESESRSADNYLESESCSADNYLESESCWIVLLTIISSLVSLTISLSPSIVSTTRTFWSLSSKHVSFCFQKCSFSSPHHSEFRTLFYRCDQSRHIKYESVFVT